MFDIEICEAKRVSLVSFHGELTARDFEELDRLARTAGDGGGFHCIYDTTRVTVNALVTDFVASRGQLPQTFKDYERFYVVPQDDLKLLVRLYIAYQASQRAHPPLMVDSLDEALRRLGVDRSEFRTVFTSP